MTIMKPCKIDANELPKTKRSIVNTLCSLDCGCHGLTGRRKVGKTIALKQFCVDCNKNYAYIDYSLYSDSYNDVEVFLEDLEEIIRGYGVVVFDEISLLSKDLFWSFVSTIKTYSRNTVVIISGSCKGHIDALNYTIGRGEGLVLYDLNFYEYCMWKGIRINELSMNCYYDWYVGCPSYLYKDNNPIKYLNDVWRDSLNSYNKNPDKNFGLIKDNFNEFAMYMKCACRLSISEWELITETPKYFTDTPKSFENYLNKPEYRDYLDKFKKDIEYIGRGLTKQKKAAMKEFLLTTGLVIRLDSILRDLYYDNSVRSNSEITSLFTEKTINDNCTDKQVRVLVEDVWDDHTEILIVSPWMIRNFLPEINDPQLVDMRYSYMLEYYVTLALTECGLSCYKNSKPQEIDVIGKSLVDSRLTIGVECKDKKTNNIGLRDRYKYAIAMNDLGFNYKFITTKENHFIRVDLGKNDEQKGKPCYIVPIFELLYFLGGHTNLTNDDMNGFIDYIESKLN